MARAKFVDALCGALPLLLGVVGGVVWNWRAGLCVCGAALAGMAAGRFAFDNSADAEAAPSEDRLHEMTQPTSLPAKASAASNESPPSAALFEATMNGMREGALVVDQALRVIAANSAARRIFNCATGALEGQRLSELTRNASIHGAFSAAIERGERGEVKVELHGPERRSFDVSIVPLRLGHDDRPHGAIGVFFDITQLERLERVRQEFLSNVSHELRTPLTSIIAFVETLQDGAFDDAATAARFLEIIRKNAARMHTLIDDILELSAIEAGNVRVEVTEVRLAVVLADVITALANAAAARGITMRSEVGADVIVRADARRLEQMLTNLVSNAIKFNRDGGLVTITHESIGERDRISVSDTGEGIPSEHLERLFERFYRVDRARSREMGGTGLGLAIVKHLTRAHGGEVGVRSTPNEGSTFTIELPAAAAHSPVARRAPARNVA